MKKLLCYIFGHNMYKVLEIDNEFSKYGYCKCSRCEYEDHFQYDYAPKPVFNRGVNV